MPIAGHTVPADIQHSQGRAIKRIMIPGRDMPDVFDIPRKALIIPSTATQNKSFVRQRFCYIYKEFFNPLFAIRKSISEKSQVTTIIIVRTNWMVTFRIESV